MSTKGHVKECLQLLYSNFPQTGNCLNVHKQENRWINHIYLYNRILHSNEKFNYSYTHQHGLNFKDIIISKS